MPMLTEAQLYNLRDRLVDRVSMAELAQLCAQTGTPIVHITISPSNLGEAILLVVTYFNTRGQLEIFVGHFATMFRTSPGGSEGERIASEIEQFMRPPPLATALGRHPLQAILVPPQISFFNRRSLRAALKDFTDPAMSFRIVAIHGPDASGKSHSWNLVKHVGERCTRVRVVRVLLNDYVEDASIEPAELMEEIARKIGVGVADMPRATRAQEARIVIKLVNWMIDAYTRRSNPGFETWLVIDGFNLVGCPGWATQMGQRLATEVAAGQFADFKLVLIGLHYQSLALDTQHHALRDEALQATRSEVWDFMVDFANDNALSLQNLSPDIVLDAVFQGLPSPLDHESYQAVDERVRKFFDELKPGIFRSGVAP